MPFPRRRILKPCLWVAAVLVAGGCGRAPGPGAPPPAANPAPIAVRPAPVEEIEARLTRELRLASADLKKDLEAGGPVERERAAPAAAAGSLLVAGKVRTRLLADLPAGALEIAVEAEGGHVTLKGRVASPEDLQKALLAAFKVKEVRRVTSRLELTSK